MKMRSLCAVSVATIVLCAALSAAASSGGPMDVKAQLNKFAPVSIAVDPRLMDSRQRRMVGELVEAARLMDEIFLRQVYDGNVALRKKLSRDKKSPELYDYFIINFGPFDRLDHDRPFVADVGAKPAGAAFYPSDLTKEEFNKWIAAHPEARDAFEDNFTVIRRKGAELVAIPFSEEYRELLTPAAAHLRKAASFADNEGLKKFLLSRADAFLSNDYFPSDVDWVRLKGHDIETVIGPYEVYEDNLMGYKAGFEAFITRVDPAESARLSKVVDYLDEMERRLPIEEKYKGIGRNLTSPIIVAQLIYSGGEAKAGVQTLAFNLPNDERVREQEGSKKVMLKNVQQAKFEKILVPIARLLIKPDDAANVDFEAFFAHTLLHEISHGIGPGKIGKGSRESTVGKELAELYSIVEECKADVLGVYNALFLAEKGLYPASFAEKIWPTYLAGLFRSMRFGIKEAHGGGNAIQFNYLMSKGGIRFDEKSGLYGVDRSRIGDALKMLAREVLMIEAKGDYAGAKAFVGKYSVMPEGLSDAISRLGDIPVDIKPIYEYK